MKKKTDNPDNGPIDQPIKHDGLDGLINGVDCSISHALWDDVRLEDFSIDEPIGALSAAIGTEATKSLIKEFGGDTLYLPKKGTLLRKARNRRILKEFSGDNYKELSKKYKLTIYHIRQIIKMSKK
jgi:hypothetical protein